jgi:predicted CXXCH cytochrome family protein
MSENLEDVRRRESSLRLLSRLVILLGGVALLAWSLVLLGTLTQPPPAELDPIGRPWNPGWSAPAEPGRYVGATTCRECHPGEAAAFARSGHAQTLRRAGSDPIAQRLDGQTIEDPERPGVVWSYQLRNGALSVDRREHGKAESFPIEFTFGSGHVGFTFVTTTKPGTGTPPVGIEHRLSYLAVGRKLGITPGQQAESVAEPGTKIVPQGRLLGEPQILQCFKCHVTTTSSRDLQLLDTSAMIPNVTCERCHGPGGEHIEAARRGVRDGELRMLLGLDRASPSEQITACGECHRSPDSVAMGSLDPDNLQIIRFQPIGLAKSKCFQGGTSGLSCTRCHDPHARVSQNTAAYEAVCLECHQSAGEAKMLCPVSPAKDCVGCHMPRRGVTAEFQFTNHWIQVPSQGRKSAPGH